MIELDKQRKWRDRQGRSRMRRELGLFITIGLRENDELKNTYLAKRRGLEKPKHFRIKVSSTIIIFTAN